MPKINPFAAVLRIMSDATDVLLLRSQRVQEVNMLSWRWIVACMLFAACSAALVLLQTGDFRPACVTVVVAAVAPYLWVLPYPSQSDERREMTRRGYCTVSAAMVIVALSFLVGKDAVVVPSILAVWLIVASAAVFFSGGRTW